MAGTPAQPEKMMVTVWLFARKQRAIRMTGMEEERWVEMERGPGMGY